MQFAFYHYSWHGTINSQTTGKHLQRWIRISTFQTCYFFHYFCWYKFTIFCRYNMTFNLEILVGVIIQTIPHLKYGGRGGGRGIYPPPPPGIDTHAQGRWSDIMLRRLLLRPHLLRWRRQLLRDKCSSTKAPAKFTPATIAPAKFTPTIIAPAISAPAINDCSSR